MTPCPWSARGPRPRYPGLSAYASRAGAVLAQVAAPGKGEEQRSIGPGTPKGRVVVADGPNGKEQLWRRVLLQLKRISMRRTWRWLFPLELRGLVGQPYGSGVASTRGQADGLGRCSSKAASWAAGAARVVGLGRPRAKWLRGQRWDGRGSVAASATGVSARAPAGLSYAISIADADARRLLTWALGHREPPPLGTGCDLTASGAAPQVLAGLRNLVISLVRRAGHSNVAALRRHNAHLSEDMITYQAGELSLG